MNVNEIILNNYLKEKKNIQHNLVQIIKLHQIDSIQVMKQQLFEIPLHTYNRLHL